MELSALLQPWHAALGKLRATSEGNVLWVDFGDRPTTLESVVSKFEGVELVAWLARASADQFRATVDHVWPAHGANTQFGRVGVRLHNGHFGSIALRVCFSPSVPTDSMDEATDEAIPSPYDQYIAARATMKRACEEHTEILVRVDFDRWRDWNFLKQFDLVVDAVRAEVGRRRSGTSPDETRLNLRTIDIGLGSRTQPLIVGPHLMVLNELRSYGVKVRSCGQPHFDAFATSSEQAQYFTAVQKLFRTHEQASDTSVVYSTIDTLWLHSDGDTEAVAQRLFSAVAACRSVRKVNFHASVYPHELALKAVTLALFSSAARHGVERVSIQTNTAETFQALREILAAEEDPLVVVFRDQIASIRAHQQLEASASRFVLFDPAAHVGDDNAVVATYEHKGLRILGHEEAWWRVLLPAWGQAWVHDSDITITTSSHSPVRKMGNRAVRDIELKCHLASLGHCKQLVKSMNPFVEKLKLCVDDQAAPVDGWSSVLVSFPYLRRLHLQFVRSDQLESIVRTLAQPGVSPLLARLQLGVLFKAEALPVVFYEALTDPSHRLYQCLVKLNLTVARRHAVGTLTAQLTSVLETNKRLVSLRVSLEETRPVDSLERALLRHNGELLSEATRSLGMHQKLAFLSTHPGAGSIAARVAMPPLDSEVVAIIFQYAADHSRRGVIVRAAQLY